MNLTDEQLDALAERFWRAYDDFDGSASESMRAVAREAARWAAEQQGEVVWQYQSARGEWVATAHPEYREAQGIPVRAIRVIATTTKEGV